MSGGGAGSSGAGAEGAGSEAGPVAADWVDATLPHALFLDPGTMDFPVDDDGNLKSIHPVDHEVLNRLAVALGTIAGLPDFGSELRTIEIASRAKMTAQMRERVNAALVDMVARGDVAVVDVQAYSPMSGRAKFKVVYRNLRLMDERDGRTNSIG